MMHPTKKEVWTFGLTVGPPLAGGIIVKLYKNSPKPLSKQQKKDHCTIKILKKS